MAQQVFNQWLPVAKAQNEQGQEVYLPFAGIHMQTRDGNDEVIVGAGNMVWTGSMWVPVSTQNRLPVDAAVSGTVDVSDRADRQLGKVTLSGSLPQPSGPIPVDVKSGGPATYKLVEQRTEADAVGDTLSFSGPIITVEIWNLDPYNVGVFVVNGVSITMPPQAHFFAQVGTVRGTDVTVSGSEQYIVGRYE